MSASSLHSEPRSESASAPVRTAKLFKNGRSQAVRLPKEFRFEGTEVMIQRDEATGAVTLTPKLAPRERSWEELFASWDALGKPDLDFERHVSYPVERDFF
jgi:antitoxin VapB